VVGPLCPFSGFPPPFSLPSAPAATMSAQLVSRFTGMAATKTRLQSFAGIAKITLARIESAPTVPMFRLQLAITDGGSPPRPAFPARGRHIPSGFSTRRIPASLAGPTTLQSTNLALISHHGKRRGLEYTRTSVTQFAWKWMTHMPTRAAESRLTRAVAM
jgi:hypothetical protein